MLLLHAFTQFPSTACDLIANSAFRTLPRHVCLGARGHQRSTGWGLIVGIRPKEGSVQGLDQIDACSGQGLLNVGPTRVLESSLCWLLGACSSQHCLAQSEGEGGPTQCGPHLILCLFTTA